MSKRLSLTQILRQLAPTSRREDCLAALPECDSLRRDCCRQQRLWEDLVSLCTSPHDDGTLELDFAGGEDSKPQDVTLSVAGCDEVGRGPLAGPLVAAAVILPRQTFIPGLKDSKQLSHEERLAMVPWIKAQALSWAIAEIGMDELNAPLANINTLSLKAMTQALTQLTIAPSFVLVDGKYSLPSWSGQQRPLIKGDSRCLAIAAASVLAKVHRDQFMIELGQSWPQYGFAEHKGYGTAQHLLALQRYGPCPWHRRHYAPVQECASRLSNPNADPIPGTGGSL